MIVYAQHLGSYDLDGDLEVATLDLAFADSSGAPLTTGQVNQLIDRVQIYRETEILPFLFDPAQDLLAVTVDILTLDADTGVPVGMNYTFFTEQAPETGAVQTVTLDMTDADTIPDDLRVYLMVDAYPAAVDTLPAP